MQQPKQDEYKVSNTDLDAALFDRYAQSIFAYVRLHISSREDAEDMTLEVFTAALEHNNLVGLTGTEQLTWLRRVAHNKLVDTYRRTSRHPSVPLDKLAETLYDDERLSPEHVALRHETYSELHSALGTLSSLQQQVLQLRFGHGLRFADIAILLDKREEAVRKLLSRALQSLRSVLAQQHQGGKRV